MKGFLEEQLVATSHFARAPERRLRQAQAPRVGEPGWLKYFPGHHEWPSRVSTEEPCRLFSKPGT